MADLAILAVYPIPDSGECSVIYYFYCYLYLVFVLFNFSNTLSFGLLISSCHTLCCQPELLSFTSKGATHVSKFQTCHYYCWTNLFPSSQAPGMGILVKDPKSSSTPENACQLLLLSAIIINNKLSLLLILAKPHLRSQKIYALLKTQKKRWTKCLAILSCFFSEYSNF